MSETAEKLIRVRKYLKAHQLDGIVLTSRSNFAWLSGGGDNHVVSQSAGALVVTAKETLVVANQIEIDRLSHEEPLSGFAPKTFPWVQSLSEALPKLLKGKNFLSDDLAASRQAVAWNPSITGTKSEDTFMVDGDQKVALSACSSEWPTLTVSLPKGGTYQRPAILVR